LQLSHLGWNSRLSNEFNALMGDDPARSLVPARVIAGQRDLCTVAAEDGEYLADVAGRFRLTAAAKADYPVVGDWVAIAPRPGEGRATIHAVLPRAGAFRRMAALSAADPHERAEEQVAAANVDTALIVMSLDHDFNVRRLERYLTLAWGSGVQPVVVLNKADLCEELPERLAETEAVAVGVPVLTVSATDGSGVEALAPHLPAGKTAALMGSSGVGKSTLINCLLGEERMATGAVREDDQRGRHTTTHRELVVLPTGAILVDNPGMRAVGLWGDEADLDSSFADIEELARGCRFADCRHGAEPGCAVRGALEDGTLDRGRWASWHKLQKELAFLATRDDVRAQAAQRQMMKARAKSMKGFTKHRSR
jgi:ribosome biogenesis GTPase / thiamine phosphate phosphatase